MILDMILRCRSSTGKAGLQSLEISGIGPPFARVALLIVPLIRVAAFLRSLAAVAVEEAKVSLIPLQAIVEVDARHVSGQAAEGKGYR